jgi:hypothetical protein
MRLYDVIQQNAGTALDRAFQGLIGSFAAALRQSECFELTPPVVSACGQVCASKPSSILAATAMLRLPYEHTWLEWYGDRGDYIKENQKIVPDRMGCLLTAVDNEFNRGYAYWAWFHHTESLTIAPFGIAFDWDTGRPPVLQQLLEHHNLPAYLMHAFEKRVGDKLAAQAVLVNSKKWYDKTINKDQKEIDAFIQLEKRATIVPNHYATKFIAEYNLLDPNNPGMANFTDDVCGELPFIESFIIMLNSKHILDKTADDFSKLNKVRVKTKKAPLREFTTTRLRLTRTTENRMRAAGMDRSAARMHLVRGHFKLRKSGCYWWSPFARGHGGTPPKRREYKAT